jgi:hypothetical protein
MVVEIKPVRPMGRQSELDVGQRVEIVLTMLRKGEPIATLARRHNVSETTLHRWREEFPVGGQAALADRHPDRAQALAALMLAACHGDYDNGHIGTHFAQYDGELVDERP